jgi:hypothetical protein
VKWLESGWEPGSLLYSPRRHEGHEGCLDSKPSLDPDNTNDLLWWPRDRRASVPGATFVSFVPFVPSW